MIRRLCRVSALVALLVTFVNLSYSAANRWIRLKSAHFEMFSSAGPKSARETLREFEQIRGFFVQATGGHAVDTPPVRLVVFGSPGEYAPYRLNEFAVAYYHGTTDRDYIVMSRSGSGAFPIAVHEYVHFLMRHAGLKLPPWLNEGLAELYSTIRPQGDQIFVGGLIAARRQALLRDKWVPLSSILAANRSSPYYNQKNEAGSLYNESWGLTHMLYFRPEYRLRFNELLNSVAGGEESVHALERLYGRPLDRIEKDLQGYLNGTFFQGALIPAKFESKTEDVPADPLPDFDLRLVLADLIHRAGNEAPAEAELQRLAQEAPKRPEPHRELAYIAWRAGRRDEAIRQFGAAFDCGARDTRLLWDYGRLLEAGHPEDAIRVLSELLKIDGTRADVRMELEKVQLRAASATAPQAGQF